MNTADTRRRTARYALMSIFAFAVAEFFLSDLVQGFFPASPALSTMLMRWTALSPWWMGGASDPGAEVWRAEEVYRLIACCLTALTLALPYFLLGLCADRHRGCLAAGLGLYAADALLALYLALSQWYVPGFDSTLFLYPDCTTGQRFSPALVTAMTMTDLAVRAFLLFLIARGLTCGKKEDTDKDKEITS